MKKIIILLSILSIFLISCNKKPYNMRVCTGSGLTYTETWLRCDSFQMISVTEAYIWSDGAKMHVIGDRGIRPETNF